MRSEHRKLSLAIVVALDRSGSMAAPAGGGQTKMDLANIGTVEVLDLLSPMDEIGVIAVDSSPHVIVELDTVGHPLMTEEKDKTTSRVQGRLRTNGTAPIKKWFSRISSLPEPYTIFYVTAITPPPTGFAGLLHMERCDTLPP